MSVLQDEVCVLNERVEVLEAQLEARIVAREKNLLERIDELVSVADALNSTHVRDVMGKMEEILAAMMRATKELRLEAERVGSEERAGMRAARENINRAAGRLELETEKLVLAARIMKALKLPARKKKKRPILRRS